MSSGQGKVTSTVWLYQTQFAFMHLADAFTQSDSRFIQDIHLMHSLNELDIAVATLYCFRYGENDRFWCGLLLYLKRPICIFLYLYMKFVRLVKFIWVSEVSDCLLTNEFHILHVNFNPDPHWPLLTTTQHTLQLNRLYPTLDWRLHIYTNIYIITN